MVQSGYKSIRASFTDATDRLARETADIDLPADAERDGVLPGQWAGAPADCLPPNCPVTPLGIDGKTSYFVDTSGQLIAVTWSEWSKKTVIALFARLPNYPYWAWPRWNAKTLTINGLDADDAVQCLVKAAAMRGLFSPQDRVRGRGAWKLATGELVWHSGDALWRVDGRRLKRAAPGELDGIFYPTRPAVSEPWKEPVDPSDSPVHKLLADLRSWSWERRILDPLIILGWIGCAFLGGALDWRPHLFVTGDRGVGKSKLQSVLKAILGASLHATADTTAAGIYQRVQTDCLPVAIDELESSARNDRVMAVVNLARLAASGALMYRGGAEHVGVEFRLQNTFAFSAINPPPLEPQDRSRMAIVNLGRLARDAREFTLENPEAIGRMILRALMDGWKDFPRRLADWRSALHAGGLDSRAQDTYGTLLAVANLLLGDEALEAAGLHVTEAQRLGEQVARETLSDRADVNDNWRDCFEHLLSSPLDAWKGGEKPTVGGVLEAWEQHGVGVEETNKQLASVGLKALERDGRAWLAIPVSAANVPLKRLYGGSKWPNGVWATALKQAPHAVVIRDLRNGQNVKINRQTARCLLVDLRAYDEYVANEQGDSSERMEP